MSQKGHLREGGAAKLCRILFQCLDKAGGFEPEKAAEPTQRFPTAPAHQLFNALFSLEDFSYQAYSIRWFFIKPHPIFSHAVSPPKIFKIFCPHFFIPPRLKNVSTHVRLWVHRREDGGHQVNLAMLPGPLLPRFLFRF